MQEIKILTKKKDTEMILQFSIKNYKTFKEKATLSFIASNYDKETREDENIYYNERFGFRLLKSAVVFGANASGKSKLFEAFRFMKRYIRNSSKEGQKGDEIDVDPFRLNSLTENEPSEFEITFIHRDVQYRYGFEVTRSEVISEWLYQKRKIKEVELFYRDDTGVELHERNFSKGKRIVKEELLRENALLISVAAQFNDVTSIEVLEWFKGLINLSGLDESGYKGFTVSKADDLVEKIKILNLLKAADLGIKDIQPKRLDLDKLPKDLPEEIKNKILREVEEEKAEFFSGVLTAHDKHDEEGNSIDGVQFSLEDDESSGTRKFFALTGPILDVLKNGYILVVDELDSKLHPNLVCKIVSLFNSKEFNPNNAQLIFNTHNTNLLNSGLFRRDQIWFTEKNKFGEAKLFSLADFKSKDVNKKDPFEEHYIDGRYGAIPFLGLFDNLDYILSPHEDEK
ncbi:ATP/GTP-binding protein [uncultured Flavobacterium sp.]|uniref:AAA family ATPase n=1 Tax=uncultured Flavobacterium sp. TaxID=165435 RepID=UPI0025F6BA17|nr:ATP-binding protein [uncultured Flavobacterium sp.]